eukprot:6075169-Prymnesium_polylepis.2
MAGQGREDATWRSAAFGAMRREGASTERRGWEWLLVAASAQRSIAHPQRTGEHAQLRTQALHTHTCTHPDVADVWASGGMFGRGLRGCE